MPSKTTLFGVLWALVAIAGISRVPQAKAVLFGE